MADDIDDLLDEVESKFCSGGHQKKESNKKFPIRTSNSNQEANPGKSSRNKSFTDDISSAIDDIMADDGLEIKFDMGTKSSHPPVTQTNSNSSQMKLKCSSIYVGGSSSKLGVSSSTNSQCCNRLHCTTCDNQIVFFEDFKWDEEKCDYLAFRNNYPDYKRLKYLLVPRKGYRVYCCQCSWLTSKDMAMLRSLKPDFKWVCKKH